MTPIYATFRDAATHELCEMLSFGELKFDFLQRETLKLKALQQRANFTG